MTDDNHTHTSYVSRDPLIPNEGYGNIRFNHTEDNGRGSYNLIDMSGDNTSGRARSRLLMRTESRFSDRSQTQLTYDMSTTNLDPNIEYGRITPRFGRHTLSTGGVFLAVQYGQDNTDIPPGISGMVSSGGATGNVPYEPEHEANLTTKKYVDDTISFAIDEVVRLANENDELAEQNQALFNENRSLRNAVRVLNDAWQQCREGDNNL